MYLLIILTIILISSVELRHHSKKAGAAPATPTMGANGAGDADAAAAGATPEKQKQKKPKIPPTDFKTPLFAFAKGAASILAAPPANLSVVAQAAAIHKVAMECTSDYWKIKQPSVQRGTAVFYQDLNTPLLKIRELVNNSIIQVCLKFPQDLRTYLYEQMDAKADPNAPLTPTKRRRVLLQLELTKRHTKKVAKKKSTVASGMTSSASKSKTGTYWDVLIVQMPEVIVQMKLIRDQLRVIVGGYIGVQFNAYIDCLAKSVVTEHKLNTQLVAYRSLMKFALLPGAPWHNFINVFTKMLCNYDQFYDFVEFLNKGVTYNGQTEQWNLFGQAWGKFVVALATGIPLDKKRR